MGKQTVLQGSFNAGEFAPNLDGQVLFDKYPSAAKKMSNFFATVQGAAIKRSGFKFVKEVNDSTAKPLLVPFEFGTTQAYMLEFGNLYMRVYKDGGAVLEANVTIVSTTDATPVVVTATAHGYSDGDEVFVSGVATATSLNNRFYKIANKTDDTFELVGTTDAVAGAGSGGTVAKVYEIVTVYTTAQLPALSFAQSADVLYVASPDVPPHKIERTGHTSWTDTEIAFDWPPFAPQNVDDTDTIIYSAAEGTGITLTSPGGHFTSGMVGGFVRWAEDVEANRAEWTSFVAITGAPYAQYLGQLVGGFFAAGTSQVHSDGNVYEFTKDINAGSFSGVTAPIHREGTKSDGRLLWKYINSGFGYAKITSFTDAFRVVADVVVPLPIPDVSPDIAITSSTEGNPVSVTSAAHGFSTGDKVYIQGVATATVLNQRTFIVTRVSATVFTLDDEDGTGIGIGSGGIVVLVKAGELQETSETSFQVNPHRWAFSAFSTENGFPRAVTFFEDRLCWAGTSADPQSFWASATGEYENHETGTLDADALLITLGADQVNVIEWMSASDKIALGTAGGEFLMGSADGDSAMTAGNVRAVRQSNLGSKAAVQPVRVEQVALFVQRAGRSLREFVFDQATGTFTAADLTVLSDHIAIGRIAKMAFQQEPHRLLWCVLEDGSLICFTFDRAQEVLAWHNHPVGGTDVVVESVAVIPSTDGSFDQVWIIVKRTVNSGTVRYVELLQETWREDFDISDAFFVDSGLIYDSTAVTTIQGLNHLEGETVEVIGDGIVQTSQVVSGGAITIVSASTVQVGLGYDAILQGMRPEAGSRSGTSQGQLGRIIGAVLRLYQTGEGLLYGPNDTSSEMDTLAITPGTLLDGDTVRLPWPTRHNQSRHVTVKHTQPTPCTIVAFIPQVDVDDRAA